MTIIELAELLGKDIVFRRYSGQNGRINTYFEYCELKEFKESGIIVSVYGNGKTIKESINDISQKISGRILVFNARNGDRMEFNCPKLDPISEV